MRNKPKKIYISKQRICHIVLRMCQAPHPNYVVQNYNKRVLLFRKQIHY